jgi:single-stranded DNA-specific DHH superfamily exonuclease
MRYRVKVVDLNSKSKNNLKADPLAELKTSSDENQNQTASDELESSHEEEKYLIQNWQFEIRKLTYEDAGTYTCLLPLVKPITKNITLQVIRKTEFILWVLPLRSDFRELVIQET